MFAREIQLTTQIVGTPAPGHFTVAATGVDGEVVVRTGQVGLAATYLESMRAECTLRVPAWQPGRRVGVAAIGTWLGEGRLVYPRTVIKGEVEDVPQALLSLLRGSCRGNVSVRLS